MSFSFRNLFQRGAGSNEPGQSAQHYFEAGAHPQRAPGTGPHSLSPMQALPPQQFPAGASPFQVGGNPLFKTAGNESIAAPPINSATGMSPFSVIGATPTNAPLTVGDVIHQLPPEEVRMGALPAEQPLSLPPALLENALRSGQAALPLFELYRVCPALFQVPISPQDPRLVALPATKLPGLIAQAREGHAAAPTPAAQSAAPSPFSLVQPATPPPVPMGSPFQMAQPTAEPAPQQQPASPFTLGAAPGASPFGMPQQSAAAPASPFSSLGASPVGSPFSMPQQAAAEAPAAAPQASPFTLGAASGGSPFGMPQQSAAAAPMAAPASPFGMPQQSAAAPASPFALGASPAGSPFSMPQPSAGGTPAASPFSSGAAAGGSPFGMPQASASPFPAAPPESQLAPAVAAQPQASISVLFTPQAQQRASTPSDMATAPGMPFGSPFVSAMQEAAPQAESPAPSAFAQQPPSAGAASGLAKLGFAAVLSGYSVEELGFNPTTLPAWITTSVQASTLHEQIPSGNVILELGMLVDGISDLGFRNTLGNAKRDFKIKVPQNEVFHALTHLSAAPAAAVASFGSPSPAAAPARLSVQPNPAQQPAQNAQPMFAAPQAQAPAAPSQMPMFGASLTPFTQAAAPAPVPGFGSAQPAGGPAPFDFSAPAAAAPVSVFGSAQPASNAAPFAFSAPAAVPAPGSVFGSAQPASNAAPFAFSAPAAVPAPGSVFGSAQPASIPAPFAFSPPAEAPAPAPVSAFGAAQPSNGPAQFGFSPPAATPSPVSIFATVQPASAPAQFSFSPPAALAEAAPPPASPPPFSAAPSAAAAPAAPLQPLASAFSPFGAPQPLAVSQPAAQPSSPLAGTTKPFDPFASSSTGPLAAKAPAESGFSSAQLLGHAPAPQQHATPFAPAPEIQPVASLFAAPAPAPFQPTPSFAPALEEIPSFSTPAAPAPQPASRGLFSTQAVNVPLFAESAAPPQARPEPQPAPAAPAPPSTSQAAPSAAAPAKMEAVKHSFLGLSPLDTQTDQLLLRALLGTEEKLAAPRVVELLALQQGLSACVCLHGSHVLSHADSTKPDAAEFQRQAPDIARQLRGLAPLIGIEGAETFTLNAGGRLLTFCFPGDSIIGVLHDAEPSTGMRDKITLIARELARMLG